MNLIVFSDGGARGNPGPAGIGFVIKADNGNLVFEKGEYIGEATNNIAEYTAILRALEYIKDHKLEIDSIVANLDSELVVRQLNQIYKVKDEKLKKLYLEVRELVMELGGSVTFNHIPRSQNAIADKLYNDALDNRQD